MIYRIVNQRPVEVNVRGIRTVNRLSFDLRPSEESFPGLLLFKLRIRTAVSRSEDEHVVQKNFELLAPG